MDNHGTHDGDDQYFELLCNDLLEVILLRLHSPVCLIRAASVCKRWRRVIADDSGFLRRIHSLHRPTVYGHYSSGHQASLESFMHNEKPVPFFLPSPSVAIGFGGNHLSSPDFLNSYHEILDSCGSLLLLRPRRYTLQGITVYEPLTRRCRVIDDPPAPWKWEGEHCHYRDWSAYLLSGGADGDDEAAASLSSFRVVCTFYDLREHAAYAAVLLISAGYNNNDDNNNGWRFTRIDERLHQRNFVGRVGCGSIYWATAAGNMHVLNGITMEASSSMFPDMGMWNSSLRHDTARLWHHSRTVRVVNCGGGAARIVCLAGRNVEIFARRPCAGGEWWVPEKSVRLPEDTRPFVAGNWYSPFMSGNATIVAAGSGFVVFAPTLYSRLLFHMDLETEVVTLMVKHGIYSAGLQFPAELPWPPNVRACVDETVY